MLINVRPIATSVAVISFFGLSLLMVLQGLAPLTCCKRAVIGSAVLYIATIIAMKIVNAIISKAIIDSHINKQEE